jgi:hypothetical protein
MEPARMGIWSGMDIALSDNGYAGSGKFFREAEFYFQADELLSFGHK